MGVCLNTSVVIKACNRWENYNRPDLGETCDSMIVAELKRRTLQKLKYEQVEEVVLLNREIDILEEFVDRVLGNQDEPPAREPRQEEGFFFKLFGKLLRSL